MKKGKIQLGLFRMSLIIFVLISILTQKELLAQNNTSCSNPVMLTVGSCVDNFTSSDSIVWFSVAPTDTVLAIGVYNYYTTDDSSFVDIKLFNDCVSITPLDSAVFSPPATYMMTAHNLIAGNTYFLSLKKSNNLPALINICNVTPQSVPCACPVNGFNPNNPCDVICNGGFEILSDTVTNWGDLPLACPWYDLQPSIQSTELFNTTASNINFLVPTNYCGVASSYNGGDGYAGIITFANDPSNVPVADYREYIVQQLASPLQNGVQYEVTFYVLLGDYSGYTSSGIGASFYNSAPVQPVNGGFGTYMAPGPAGSFVSDPSHISNTFFNGGWKKIQGTITGSGQDYIAIGQFTNDGTNHPNLYNIIAHNKMINYSYYFVDSVSVHPVGPIVSAGPDLTICTGTSVQLIGTVSGGYTSYEWIAPTGTLCTGCTTVSVSPTVTTTYTFVAYNSNTGCNSDIATTTINVNPIPDATITGLQANNCSANPNVSISYFAPCDPNVTYQWVVSGATSDSVSGNGCQVDVNWTDQGGTLTLTATSLDGCTSTTTMVIPACCSPGNPFAPYYIQNTTASAFLASVSQSGPNVTYPYTIMISGVFTIDVPFTFLNCPDVELQTNAKIDIQPGQTLGIDHSVLHAACNLMWDGIYLNNNSCTLNVSNNSIIRDAKNAIVSIAGGVYHINRTTMQNNLKSVVVKAYAFQHNGTITNTTFNTLSNVPAGIYLRQTLPAYSPLITRSLIGVDVENNADIQIGDPSAAANLNTFKNIYQGIESRYSVTRVYNCKFQDILQNNSVSNSGTAILAIGIKNPYIIPSITVGGITNLHRCNFDNVVIALDTRDRVDISMRNNMVLNFHQYGLRSQTDQSAQINTLDNNFTNSSAAYSFNTAVLILDAYFANVNVTGNTIIQRNGPPAGQIGVGIRVALVAPGSLTLHVQNNGNIARVKTGIWLQNLQGKDMVFVENNAIVFAKPNAFYTTASVHYGIRTENCATVRIQYNTITKTVGGNPVAAMQQTLRGISIENSPTSIVAHNTCTRMGSGIFGWELCNNSSLVCNTLDRCWNGVFLIGGAGTGGLCEINDQVLDPNNAFTPAATGNIWLSNISFSQIDGAVVSPTLWYYDGAPPSNTAISVFSTFLTSPNACNLSFATPGFVAQREQQAGTLIRDVNLNNQNPSHGYFERQSAYRRLTHQQAWLNLNTPDDTLYQNFYSTNSNTNLGAFQQAEINVDTGNYQNVNAICNSISCSSTIEHNLKNVYRIYAATWMQGMYSFTSADSATLLAIANLDPVDGGTAVYNARAMLDLPIDYFGQANSERIGAEANAEIVNSSSQYKMYPNPAAESLTIEFNIEQGQIATIEIFDLSGKLILSNPLQPHQQVHVLDTHSLIEGVYLVQITVNGELLESKRLIIIK